MQRMHAVRALGLPSSIPAETGNYIAHVELGRPIREIARACGKAPSTVMRRIRRLERRRDDPLIDEALTELGPDGSHGQESPMTETDTPTVEREARRILRRLSESGAVLAVAKGMETAVVLRQAADGQATRTATLGREIARALALRDWIACDDPSAPVIRYRITAAGRAALRRLLDEETQRRGLDDAPLPSETAEDAPRKGARYVAETPMAVLARRRDAEGRPFLSPELVAAGERLREDSELAQAEAPLPPAETILAEAASGDAGRLISGGGPEAARARLLIALSELGPGLGDVAYRTCCLLEGLETAERRMGWSARSGKVVLRIALQRLRRHYDETEGRYGAMIG